jgi:hypothetical protein
MKSNHGRAARLVLGFGLVLAMTGCIGFAVGDRNSVEAAEPDAAIFGDSFDRGYFDGGAARDYRFRGAQSRGSRAP